MDDNNTPKISRAKELKLQRKARLWALRPFMLKKRPEADPEEPKPQMERRAPKPKKDVKKLGSDLLGGLMAGAGGTPKAPQGAFFARWTARWVAKVRRLADSMTPANELAKRQNRRRITDEEAARFQTRPGCPTTGKQIQDKFANPGNSHDRRIARRARGYRAQEQVTATE